MEMESHMITQEDKMVREDIKVFRIRCRQCGAIKEVMGKWSNDERCFKCGGKFFEPVFRGVITK